MLRFPSPNLSLKTARVCKGYADFLLVGIQERFDISRAIREESRNLTKSPQDSQQSRLKSSFSKVKQKKIKKKSKMDSNIDVMK